MAGTERVALATLALGAALGLTACGQTADGDAAKSTAGGAEGTLIPPV